MSNKINKDWQNFLAGLKEDTEEKKMSSEKSSGRLAGMFSGIIALSWVSAVTATLLMLANMAINSAWESIEVLTPAIGFWAAYKVTGIFWLFWIVIRAMSRQQEGAQ